MNCAISGEVPVEPVVSKKSGLLYEKRLIETHVSDFGKCPVTGEPHTIDDIVAVKTGKVTQLFGLFVAEAVFVESYY
ncbi:hypothetical protein F2Q68_00012844 [Brassica cretica]|uniref:Pre-mRNA-processing factor 19 n=1 Tax=Brassica cretica TaxID=69181 RepID=A0A8S9HM88_BRACR|nr:hypothetical protein F2Q68_00012844 [Brassica cretica]